MCKTNYRCQLFLTNFPDFPCIYSFSTVKCLKFRVSMLKISFPGSNFPFTKLFVPLRIFTHLIITDFQYTFGTCVHDILIANKCTHERFYLWISSISISSAAWVSVWRLRRLGLLNVRSQCVQIHSFAPVRVGPFFLYKDFIDFFTASVLYFLYLLKYK